MLQDLGLQLQPVWILYLLMSTDVPIYQCTLDIHQKDVNNDILLIIEKLVQYFYISLCRYYEKPFLIKDFVYYHLI